MGSRDRHAVAAVGRLVGSASHRNGFGGQVLFGPDDLAVRRGAGAPPAGQLSDEEKTAALLVDDVGLTGAWVAGVAVGDFARQDLVLDEL